MVIPEKRKSAGRRSTAEGPPTKKTATPAKDTPSKVKVMQPSIRLEEPLPSRISISKPLPVISDSHKLERESLKSIAESGVLAASIERSRTQWVSEGLFEKYWTKPGKKKDQMELSQNPIKGTMTRLGLCRIIVEPHIFEATLFTIRDPGAAPKPQPKAPKPSLANGMASIPKPGSLQQQQQPVSNPQLQQVSQTTFQANSEAKKESSQASTPQPAQSKPGQDPVIQMLAQRASKDTQLKALMQVVASGQANVEQLQVFQGHINELHSILQHQKDAESPASTPAAQPNAATGAPNTPGQPVLKREGGSNQNGPPAFRTHTPTSAATPSQKTPNPASQPPKPTGNVLPPSTNGQSVSGIAVEFTSGTGDRFLLPRNSIFDYDTTREQAILSFLVTRKGNAVDSDRYDANTEYYQPVTIRLASDQPRIFDTVSRSLHSLDVVKKHMETVLSTATRADSLPLALQLPVSGAVPETDSAPPTPVGGKPADRRQSLLKQSTAPPSRASPASERSAFEESHCMYCFEQVSTPAQKLEDKTVCSTCGPLRRKQMGVVSRVQPKRLRQPVAPMALIL